MFSRLIVWNPVSSIFTMYVPGTREGKRKTPPASVTPVIDPATRTGLVIVTVTPGTTAPCSSTARTRMLPVCTWAAAGAATVSAIDTAKNLKIRLMQFLQKGNGVSWRRRAGPSADQTVPNVRPHATSDFDFRRHV